MADSRHDFTTALLKKLKRHLESPDCRYTDNAASYYYYGDMAAMQEDIDWFKKNPVPPYPLFIDAASDRIKAQAQEKSFLYDRLQDDKSRDMLLTVAAYRILSHRLVKFPCYINGLQGKLERLKNTHQCEDHSDIPALLASGEFDVQYQSALYDFSVINVDAKAYCSPYTLLLHMEYGLYSYSHNGVDIKIEPGDYVFDCGAALGDTAFIFAAASGPDGKIFSFEPHPKMVTLLERNLSLNPQLSNIEVINKAVSDKPGEWLGFTFDGTGSTTATAHNTPNRVDAKVETTSIDFEAGRRGLKHVDFIKMDIEGAELDALLGAANCLKKFKPKLAISLYHKYGDFRVIPKFIESLNLGYKFYFDHQGMNEWESVLYALAD